MKKVERLNQMLHFINQKQMFTLKDLINEFQISKRTALRDIASLEEIGVPLLVDYGRYGGYRLLKSMTLPPISFTSHEVFALYFAMQALQSFTSSPFQISFHSINEKFLNGVSQKHRDQIESFQKRVSFYHTEQMYECVYLEELLIAAVHTKALKLQYTTPYKTTTRCILPISIYAMKGYWYCQAYDLDKKAYRVFRCDRITSLEAIELDIAEDLKEINIYNVHSLWKPSEQASRFKCLITETSLELFKQQQYPSMKVVHENENMYLMGTYEPTETKFIIQYLSSFGKSIKIVEPASLKEQLKQYYLDLINHL
ncbi:helix-turn-helix transcriptional regulator [Fictibacillus barbaricus]|uniref:DNA-binding transcriptional regulator YafY n=1 Tax=Fictibacillus barbaricus TaxID=182136 RepID=A0ABU1U234_9BACL|nr:YafY family protein [Fictibacillus barbaricus]MDR7073545.1 putative DNA-binding transcriptional regulator YafY [Fictibacillus barbaricus]